MSIKKIFFVFTILIALFLSQNCYVLAETQDSTSTKDAEIEARRIKLAELTSKLDLKRQQLEATKRQERQALNKLGTIRREMNHAKTNLSRTQRQLNQNKKLIDDLSQRLEQEQKRLQEELNNFQNRLIEIYKSNNLGYLEFFFSAENLSDFINKSYYFERIILKDIEIINKLKARQNNILRTKQDINKKLDQIHLSAQQIQEQKNAIARKEQQEKQVYSGVYAQRVAFEREVRELEQNSREIQVWIQRIVSGYKGEHFKGSGRYSWPLDRGTFYISSNYGNRRHPIFRVNRFHSGVDMAAARGTPVRAADSGTVIFSGVWGGYGNAIIIDHGNNETTVYAHMHTLIAKEGQIVYAGDRIGTVGSTGYSTGPHLHFEIRSNGQTINPMSRLPKL